MLKLSSITHMFRSQTADEARATVLSKSLPTLSQDQFRKEVIEMPKQQLQHLFTHNPGFRECFNIRKPTATMSPGDALPPIDQAARTYGLACAATMPAASKSHIARQERALTELNNLLMGGQANRQHLSGLPPKEQEQEQLLTLWKESANELIEQFSSIKASNVPLALSVLRAFVTQDLREMESKKSSTAAVLTKDMLATLLTKLTEQRPASTQAAKSLSSEIGRWHGIQRRVDTPPPNLERNRFSQQFSLQATGRTVPAPTSAPPRPSIGPAAAIPPAASAVPATATTSAPSLAKTDVASPPGGASPKPRTAAPTKNHASPDHAKNPLNVFLKRLTGRRAENLPRGPENLLYTAESLPGFIEQGAALSRTWTESGITHFTGLVEPVNDPLITEVRMGQMAKYAQGNVTGGSPLRETTTNLRALENITRFIAHLGDGIDSRVLELCGRAQEILAMPIREGSDGGPSGIPFQRLGDPATYDKGGAFADGFNETEAANFKRAVLAAAELGRRSAEVLKDVYPAHGVQKMRQPDELANPVIYDRSLPPSLPPIEIKPLTVPMPPYEAE